MSDTPNFRLNQRVYTADGRMGDYLTKVEDGPFIIRPVFESYDGRGDPVDEYADGVIEIGQIYARPPVMKLDGEVAEKNATIARLRDEIRALENEKAAFGKDHKERAERIAKHEQLATLDYFLSGAITHVVMQAGYGSGLKIVPFADALKVSEDDRYSRREPEMKLVALFGSSGGDLSWRINEYRDGSGSWIGMVPCTSEEHARSVMSERLNGKWTEYRAGDTKIWVLADAIKSAEELGITVPQDILDALAAYQTEVAQRAVAKAEAELAAALAKVTA